MVKYLRREDEVIWNPEILDLSGMLALRARSGGNDKSISTDRLLV